jgi:gamma-glutamyltranspeptidase / glutathione hydrolase
MAMWQQLSPMLATRPEVSSSRGVVSSGHPLAVDAGLGALAAGGNAVDATVAAAFASFVAEPNNAGIGGYGHVSVFLADRRSFLTVDHSPRAPGAARPDMYELDTTVAPEGHDWPSVVEDRNAAGHCAPAVPGAVAGMWALHQRAGRLSWNRLLEPAIAIADEGLEVTWILLLKIAARFDQIRADPALADILLPSGRLPRSRTADTPGERLHQQELAATLRNIAADGPAAFYDGSTALKIGSTIAQGGGILTDADLRGYAPKVFFEEPRQYRDLDYVTSADTVGYEALGILNCFALGDLERGSAEHYHLLAEAMGHAFADGATYSSDPDFTEDPIGDLGGRVFAHARAAGISLDRAAPRPIEPRAPWPTEGPARLSAGGVHGTTQVVAADDEGNLASLITTIGGDFGCRVAVPGTGIVLNNSMVNYDPRPGRSNSIAPGKMPFFAVPALVAARDGKAVFGAAGSGGYPILAGTINTFVNAVDHGLPIQAAIDEPRVHSQGDRTFIDVRVSPGVRERLRDRGHRLVVQSFTPGELPFSRVSAVRVTRDAITGGAGPSWTTAVGGL